MCQASVHPTFTRHLPCGVETPEGSRHGAAKLPLPRCWQEAGEGAAEGAKTPEEGEMTRMPSRLLQSLQPSRDPAGERPRAGGSACNEGTGPRPHPLCHPLPTL